MNQISKVVLKNFQCHKNLTVNFDTGMTCLMGSNNGGKSSSIRALYWILTNSPRGEWMRREVEGVVKKAEAYVTFTDGTVLGRIKGDKINQYTMNGEMWEKFGTNIPSPIQDYIDDIELAKGTKILPNIHMQDDPAFMVFESSSVRGALVNYLTGIDVGDRMKKGFNKTLKEIKTSRAALENAREENLESLGKFGNTKAHLKKVSSLEEFSSELKCADEKLTDCLYLSTTLCEAGRNLDKCATFDSEKFKKIEKVYKQYKQISSDLFDCSELESTFTFAANQVSTCKNKVDISQVLNKLNEMVDPLIDLSADICIISTIQKERKKAAEELSTQTKYHDNILKEIKELDIKECPTCNQIIGDDHV